MKKCLNPDCGHIEAEPGARFCGFCGERLPDDEIRIDGESSGGDETVEFEAPKTEGKTILVGSPPESEGQSPIADKTQDVVPLKDMQEGESDEPGAVSPPPITEAPPATPDIDRTEVLERPTEKIETLEPDRPKEPKKSPVSKKPEDEPGKNKWTSILIPIVLIALIIGIYFIFSTSNTWVYSNIKKGVNSTPLVFDDHIFVTAKDNRLYCLDRMKGKELWHFETEGMFYTSPAISDGRICVASRDETLYCIDSDNGRLLWKFKVGEGPNSPAIFNGRVYVTDGENKIYCIDLTTGNMNWVSLSHGAITSGPVIHDGVVYFGTDKDGVLGYDAISGSPRVTIDTPGSVRYIPSIGSKDDYLVIPTYEEGGILIFYDIRGRREVGRFYGDKVFRTPAVSGDYAYVGSADGYLYAIRLDNGDEQWRFRAGGVVSSPAVTKRYIYFGTSQKRLYCLDKSGRVVLEYSTPGEVPSTPAIYDGFIYVTLSNGKVMNFEAPDDETGSWTMFKFDPANTGCPD